MRDINNTLTGATSVSLKDMSDVDSTQPHLIKLRSGKLVPKHKLSWHSNMRDISNTQTGSYVGITHHRLALATLILALKHKPH